MSIFSPTNSTKPGGECLSVSNNLAQTDIGNSITVETRATGIVSVVNIDPGKTSPYGNVVSPGALAQNHQHIFAVRIDPAIDGQANTIFTEESIPIPMNSKTNPLATAMKSSARLSQNHLGFMLLRLPISLSRWPIPTRLMLSLNGQFPTNLSHRRVN